MCGTVSIRTGRPKSLARLCGLGLFLIVAACGSIDPATELEEAEARLQAGDLRTATIHVSNVLQAEPDHIAGLVLRGRIALLAGDPAGARGALERARSLGAVVEVIGTPLADALLQLGQSDAALALLQNLPEASRDALSWVLQGEALIGVGRLEEASAALALSAELSTQLDGESARGLIAQAQIALLREQSETAEALLTRAVEVSFDAPNALSTRGAFYVRTQRFEEAALDLQAAADLYARQPVSAREAVTLSSLVQIYLTLNDVDKAAEAARRLAARAPDAPISDYATGLVAYRNGQFDQAVTSLQLAVNGAPDNLAFLTPLGAAHLALGNLGQAEQHLLDALAATPNDPAVVKLLAETRLRQQRPDAALDVLQRLTVEDSDPQIDALHVAANLQAGNVEQALDYLEQAVARSPGNQALQLQLAQAYLALNRDDAAAVVLQDISGGDEELSANLMLLFTHLRAGDVEAGRAQTEDLLARFPEEARVHAAAGVFYLLISERASAQIQFEEAVRRDGRFVSARLFLAGLLADEGRSQEAESQLREVLAIEPDNPAALASLAQLALERGDVDEAADLFELAFEHAPTWEVLMRWLQALQLGDRAADIEPPLTAWVNERPEDVAGRLVLANLFQTTDRESEALDEYERVLELEPDSIVALNNAAWLYREIAAPRALALARRATDLAPENAAVLDTLGWILVQTDRPDEAIDFLQRAVSFAPQALEIQYHLAQTQVRLGQRNEAQATLTALLAAEAAFAQREAAETLLETLR